MSNFCKYCGKPLNPGEECTCQESKQARSTAQSSGNSNSYYQNCNEKSMQYHDESNTSHKKEKYLSQYDVNTFSILSFVMAFCGLGFVGGLGCLSGGTLAIVFYAVGKNGLKGQDKIGKNLATAGLVIGIIDVVYAVITSASGNSFIM